MFVRGDKIDISIIVPVVKNLKDRFRNIKLIKNIFGPGLINACKTGFKLKRCY